MRCQTKTQNIQKTLTLFFLLLCAQGYSQTLVNREWVAFDGEANGIYTFQASRIDADGNLITIGNVLHANQAENMLISKYSSVGTLLWSQEYNGYLNNTDLAIDLVTYDDNIVVTGIQADTPTGATLITTLGIDGSGTINWTATYAVSSYHGHNIPTHIVVDGSHNVYVTGTIQVHSNLYSLFVVKYDNSGSQQWDYQYTGSGQYTGGASLCLSDVLTVYGLSGPNDADGDFLTISLDPSDGHQLDLASYSNHLGFITTPVDMGTDASHKIYEAGTVGTLGNTNIEILKIDTPLNIIWTQTLDGGDSLDDGVNSMKVDAAGNTYIAGYTTDASHIRNAWILKLNSSGSTVWDRRRLNAEANGIVIDASGNVYVTGKAGNQNLTLAYDNSGNLLWEKLYSAGTAAADAGKSISVDASGNVYVYGKTSTDSTSGYTVIKYSQYTKTNTLTATSGGGQYVKNQVIIRFDKSAIKQDAVNNTDIVIADPHYFLTDSAYDSLQAHVVFNLADCKFERIYKGLKATYKYSQARNGDMVPIPDFWAAFLLIHPDLAEGDETTVGNGINPLFPLVVHTGLNYVGQALGGCDPNPTYSISDPEFSNQYNLNSDSCSHPLDPYYGINIDSAWRLETGKSFVKVGVYDKAMQGNHADFSPITPGNSGTKAYGWDFYNHSFLDQNGWPNPRDHGTSVAGIIGAIRNNSRGIAGIAGGSYTSASDVGVTLYNMKIFDDNVPDAAISLPISDLSNAIVVGTLLVPDSNYGYGLHVINNSWMVYDTNTASGPDVRVLGLPDLQELEQAFHQAYRNQVTVVAAAGNNSQAKGYPANFFGDWILCVGGADKYGHHWLGGRGNPNNYVESYPGPCVDVTAPSNSDAPGSGDYPAYTLGSGSPFTNINTSFNGTSMAAPHVTGTVALLQSYLDTAAPNLKNLSPEDAEHLITRSAIDVDTPGKDYNTGWGLLNAGRTLQQVNKRCKELRHYDVRSDSSLSNNAPWGGIITSYIIRLSERYTNPYGITFDTIPYSCYVHTLTHTIHHNIPGRFKIEDYWTRPSSTNLLPLFDTVTHILEPFEKLYIESINNSSAVVRGYWYLVYDSSGVNYLGLWGLDTAGTLLDTASSFAYTVLLKDTTLQCDSIIIAGMKEVKSNINMSFYPNPVDEKGDLIIFIDEENVHTQIELMDMQGRTIRHIYEGALHDGTNKFEVGTKMLASGIYIIHLDLGYSKKAIKFTKL